MNEKAIFQVGIQVLKLGNGYSRADTMEVIVKDENGFEVANKPVREGEEAIHNGTTSVNVAGIALNIRVAMSKMNVTRWRLVALPPVCELEGDGAPILAATRLLGISLLGDTGQAIRKEVPPLLVDLIHARLKSLFIAEREASGALAD